jgi:hypothetical protein
MKVLSSVTNYLFFLNPQDPGFDDLASVQHDMNFALHAPRAIEKLGSMQFLGRGDYNATGDGAGVKFFHKKPNQREAKKQRQAEARKKKHSKPEEEAEIFRSLGGLSVPGTSEEAQALISQLRLELDFMFKVIEYLSNDSSV